MNAARLWRGLSIGVLVMATLANLPALRLAAEPFSPARRAVAALPGVQTVTYDARSGRVTFLMGAALYRPGAAVRGNPAAIALEFLARYPQLYGLADPAHELALLRTTGDGLGQVHVRLRQQYRGLPVFGRSLYVHLDAHGDVIGTNGHIAPDLALDTTPALGAPAAEALALRAAAESSQGTAAAARATLVVYVDDDDRARLAWQVEVWDPAGPSVDRYFVAARGGEILAVIPRLATDKVRELYDAQNRENLPGVLIAQEGEIPRDPAAKSAYEKMGLVYDYYLKTHNRDSIDDRGWTLVTVVHFSQDYNWNFWDGQHIVFGDPDVSIRGASGAFALDVVAHETTHGVVQFTADLIYHNQSGALNESYADLFGVMLDREDWHYSEDTPYGSWYPTPWAHDLEDPTLGGAYDPNDIWGSYGQPAKMSDYANFPDTREGDWGGVHTNGGITGHAAYLVAQSMGGDVAGRVPVEHIWYRALATYLTENSDFWDFATAIRQSASDLQDEYPGAVQAVEDALVAVELDGERPAPAPTPSPTPRRGATPAPLPTPANTAGCSELVKNGGFEDRRPDPWVEHGGADYALIADQWPHTGQNSVWLGGIDAEADQDTFQYIYQDVTVPANARSATLTYWRWIHPRLSDPHAGAATFPVLLADTHGQIVATLETLSSADDGDTWAQSSLDLRRYAGKTVRLAYTANIVHGNVSSLFVDDVSLLACTGDQAPTPVPGPGIAVSGLVTDADSGRGISGAGVFVLIPGLSATDATADNRVSRDEIFTYAYADRSGRYTLDKPLARGTVYSLVVLADGYYAVVADDAIDTAQWGDVSEWSELNMEMQQAR
jgi:bacillolysin